MSRIHGLGLGFALIGSALVSGCYAEAHGTTTTTAAVVDDDGYEPAYYDGYVVYYDDGGRPYYYDRGAVIWVSPRSPHYVGLVNHWHAYGPRYRVWYGHHGNQYRAYRRAPGHYSYHGHNR